MQKNFIFELAAPLSSNMLSINPPILKFLMKIICLKYVWYEDHTLLCRFSNGVTNVNSMEFLAKSCVPILIKWPYTICVELFVVLIKSSSSELVKKPDFSTEILIILKVYSNTLISIRFKFEKESDLGFFKHHFSIFLNAIKLNCNKLFWKQNIMYLVTILHDGGTFCLGDWNNSSLMFDVLAKVHF